ncbi:MAG: P-II family nitrogen regulator [Pirellulaceae bacterium]
MRLVLALIQPTKLRAVQEALARIGVDRMTVCDAQGYGQQRGQRRGAAGNEGEAILLRKVALEIAVNEDFLERAVETIAHVARTGHEGSIGDGKIFVLPVEEVVRLSDTVRGPEAVS